MLSWVPDCFIYKIQLLRNMTVTVRFQGRISFVCVILLTTMATHAMMFGHAEYLKVVETHTLSLLCSWLD